MGKLPVLTRDSISAVDPAVSWKGFEHGDPPNIQDARWLVGRVNILKEFPPAGTFRGSLSRVTREKGATGRLLYHFIYDDGDEEDLYYSQWIELCASFSSQAVHEGPRKRKQPASPTRIVHRSGTDTAPDEDDSDCDGRISPDCDANESFAAEVAMPQSGDDSMCQVVVAIPVPQSHGSNVTASRRRMSDSSTHPAPESSDSDSESASPDKYGSFSTYEGSTHANAAWKQSFEKLKSWVALHGTAEVSKNCDSRFRGLSRWVINMRRAYWDEWKRCHGQKPAANNRISADQIKAMAKLGVSWSPHKQKWINKFKMLQVACLFHRQNMLCLLHFDVSPCVWCWTYSRTMSLFTEMPRSLKS